MGQNFFHVEVAEGGDVLQIIDMKFVELNYERALMLEWHANFNISMVFPNIP